MTTTHEPTRAENRAQDRERRRNALDLIRTGLRDYVYWIAPDRPTLPRLWRRAPGPVEVMCRCDGQE